MLERTLKEKCFVKKKISINVLLYQRFDEVMDLKSFHKGVASSVVAIEAICQLDSSLSLSIKTLFGFLISICSDPMAWRTQLPMKRLAFKVP